jgi:hypothetical protein
MRKRVHVNARRSVAIGGYLLAVVLSQPASAQSPSTRADSIASTEQRTDSTVARRAHDPRMLLLLPAGAAAVLAILFVPAPLAFWLGEPDSTHHAFQPNQQSASMALGGRFQNGQTWSHAIGLEASRGDVYGEVTVEEFWRPRHIRYISLRGGRFWHPRKGVAGGLSVGYMHANAEARHRGPEFGLPLLVADSVGRSLRLEPTYVVGSSGVVFNYRLQLRTPLARSRYFAGVSLTGKGNPQPPKSSAYPGDFTGTGFMLLLGSGF